MPKPFENAEEVFFQQSDPSGPARQHNDVPYTRAQMEAWLVGAFENRYIIRAVNEKRG